VANGCRDDERSAIRDPRAYMNAFRRPAQGLEPFGRFNTKLRSLTSSRTDGRQFPPFLDGLGTPSALRSSDSTSTSAGPSRLPDQRLGRERDRALIRTFAPGTIRANDGDGLHPAGRDQRHLLQGKMAKPFQGHCASCGTLASSSGSPHVHELVRHGE
jgi:hypothetical protein